MAHRNSIPGHRRVVAVVCDVGAFERLSQNLQVEPALDGPWAARRTFDHVHVNKFVAVDTLDRGQEQRTRIAVRDVVGGAYGREPDSSSLSACLSCHRPHDLIQKTGTVLNAAAVTVRALVGLVAQKLVDEISVGRMDLDAVKPCSKRIRRGPPIILDNARQLLRLQRSRSDERLKSRFRERLSFRPNCGRSHWHDAPWLQRRVGDPPNVPKLHEGSALRIVDRLGHLLPTLDLRRSLDARSERVPLSLLGNLGGFADDQAGTGPLRIVSGIDGMRHIPSAGPASREGRHDNPIRHGERPQGPRLEQHILRHTKLHWAQSLTG